MFKISVKVGDFNVNNFISKPITDALLSIIGRQLVVKVIYFRSIWFKLQSFYLASSLYDPNV